MTEILSRRTFLRGLLAATVVGFDSHRRSWATAMDLGAGAGPLVEGFPTFEGQLLTDAAALETAAEDFGHYIHRRPLAVLAPGSVQDIVKLVRFARRYRIPVAARGQGHSTQGQAQAEAGVVIDMGRLATVHEVTAGDALVDAGVRWLDLLEQHTLSQGLTSPTLTDFLELSVGGTLSVGGLGSQTFRVGPQVDHVLELQVVTGRGQLVTCSPQHRPDLFHAARAGLGQFGMIVRARVRLVAAPPRVRWYQALYADLSAFLADLERLIDDGRFDTVQGFAIPDETSGWRFQLDTTKYFAAGAEPDDPALFADLALLPDTVSHQDMTYFEYVNRLAPLVAQLKQLGVWSFPHPWVNLFVPADQAAQFIGTVLAQLTLAEVGQGPVAIYPYRRAPFRAPLLRVPAAHHFFLFGLLRNAVPPTPERTIDLIAANRTLFEQVRPLGGTRYPIDSVPMTRQDWRDHFGPWWKGVTAAKRAYDPNQILTPGQGLF